jgi:hypothetical protein
MNDRLPSLTDAILRKIVTLRLTVGRRRVRRVYIYIFLYSAERLSGFTPLQYCTVDPDPTIDAIKLGDATIIRVQLQSNTSYS